MRYWKKLAHYIKIIRLYKITCWFTKRKFTVIPSELNYFVIKSKLITQNYSHKYVIYWLSIGIFVFLSLLTFHASFLLLSPESEGFIKSETNFPPVMCMIPLRPPTFCQAARPISVQEVTVCTRAVKSMSLVFKTEMFTASVVQQAGLGVGVVF